MRLVLGVTGSMGSGKSTVAGMLRAEGGAVLIDADQLARAALGPGMPLLAEIAAAFGADLVDGAGVLNRRELARRAFAGHAGAARLNALIHPWVRQRELELLAEHASAPLVVCDVPLLFEAGFDRHCDAVLVVTINEAQRFLRLRRRGFDEAEVIRRLAFQMPQSRKAARATYLIENSGALETTRQQVIALLGRLQGQLQEENEARHDTQTDATH